MKVFFCSYGGAHVSAILPVLVEMKNRGHESVYLALTTAGRVAKHASIPHVRPIDYIDLNDKDIQSWGRRLVKNHHTNGKGISFEESVAYLGVSFKDLVQDMGEARAWKRYEERGLNAFCPVHFLRKILEKERPDVVVATTSPRMEKAALRAAYQLGIPSLCMVELFGIMEETWLSRPDNGHVLAVSRPDVVARMVAEGRESKDIFLTGSPMFDQLSGLDSRMIRKKWRERNQISENRKVVFWAEQPEPSDIELPCRVRNHLAEICRSNGWLLVIRLHPSSTDHTNESLPQGCIQSFAQDPLIEAIHGCDVAVTLTSTVGWEVLLSKKPLLVLNISPNSYAVTYGDADGALALSTLIEAEEGLMTLLYESEKSRQLAILREALPIPGGATDRVCNLIETEVYLRRGSDV